MALLGSSITSEVGLQLLLAPISSNIVMRTACCSVGIVVPVYSSVKAIETRNVQDQQKWLLYWADANLLLRILENVPPLSYEDTYSVYGSFSIAEIYSDKLLSWFPSYYYLKLGFLIWLQLPDVHGAKVLYKKHFQPFFKRHQTTIDQIMGLTYVEMGKFISSRQIEIEYVRSMLSGITASRKESRGTVNPGPENNDVVEGHTEELSDVSDDKDHD